MKAADTTLTRVLLAAKVTGVRIELVEDSAQPLRVKCTDHQQQISFLKRLFCNNTGSLPEEFLTLKEASGPQLQQAINRKIRTGSIWSDEAFDYGC